MTELAALQRCQSLDEAERVAWLSGDQAAQVVISLARELAQDDAQYQTDGRLNRIDDLEDELYRANEEADNARIKRSDLVFAAEKFLVAVAASDGVIDEALAEAVDELRVAVDEAKDD